MLETVLLILKIAGIILAAVLGILITVICCVLFVPVRYRGDFSAGDKEDGKKEIDAMLRAAWLLWLVRVYVSYEESVRVRIKLLFFTLMDTAGEKKTRKRKEKPKKDKEERRKKKKESEAEEAQSEGTAQKDETGRSTENTDKAAKSSEEKEEGTEEKPQDSVSDEDSKKRISDMLQTIRDFCDKLRRMKGRAEKAKELWNSAHMISGRNLLWKQFLYLLKHTKPRKLEGYLRFGFEDPSATGYAMAVYGIFCSIWRPKISVEPDFEKQVFGCHVRMKGKIRVWHFLKATLVLFFSKDVRRAIKDIKEL